MPRPGSFGPRLLLVAPLVALLAAQGLFRKAIMESGTPKEVNDRVRASEVSQAYLKIAGVSSPAELQGLSMVQMPDAQKKLFDTRFGPSAFRPVVDGVLLKELPMQAIAAGRAISVPLGKPRWRRGSSAHWISSGSDRKFSDATCDHCRGVDGWRSLVGVSGRPSRTSELEIRSAWNARSCRKQ